MSATHPAVFRIDSHNLTPGSLVPRNTFKRLYSDCSLAVAVAVKSVADPTREQVRVVHVPSGEIMFETTSPASLS